ncbi:hypothetical protein PORY_002690 [Pneumocystis oryctolagi]|uniref:Uncharacterized protein n=1 Tax=Pneumocystis oryctolagi TaxID=42067 RepID=A0ACB7C8D7_9ASCO|nr:hypothetical protein PORY_002690 [Pneumocystis oryctolagi]
MLEKELDKNADQESQVGSEMSLLDYIEEQSQLEEEARESLPYSFDQCTYDRRLRQPLYVCKTCSPAKKESQKGGICYSCSIQCHGEHELIELFCKRDFRCDCGTDRLGTEMCKIRKERSPVDLDNQYNHNFEGRFCWCNIEYDPTTDERTMFQCLLCEDWFHDQCIGVENISNVEEFDLFICRTCIKKESWLKRYAYVKGFYWNKNKEHEENKIQEGSFDTLSDANHISKALDSCENRKREVNDELVQSSVKKTKTENDASISCSWEALLPGPEEDISLFLSKDFRLYMCHCVKCLSLMSKNPVLLAEEETYQPPEDNDDESLMDAGINRNFSFSRKTQTVSS